MPPPLIPKTAYGNMVDKEREQNSARKRERKIERDNTVELILDAVIMRLSKQRLIQGGGSAPDIGGRECVYLN